MKLPKSKYLFFVICIILLVLIMFYYQDRKILNEFHRFNKSLITGRISYVEEYSREASFRIENNTTKFKFYPITDEELNGSRIFSYFAKPGDSIYKAAFSDTLFLFKNGKVYRYTFQKPEVE